MNVLARIAKRENFGKFTALKSSFPEKEKPVKLALLMDFSPKKGILGNTENDRFLSRNSSSDSVIRWFESSHPCHSEPRLNIGQVRYIFVNGVAGAVFSKQG